LISEYPFREDFQLRLLSLLVRRTSEVEVRTAISAEYFGSPIHTNIARWILEAYEKHPNDRLSQASLLSLAKANLGKKRAEVWPEYRRIIKKMFSLKPTDDDFMLSQVADFVKEQDYRNALVGAEQDLNAGRFDEFRKRFNDLAAKHESPTEQQYDYDWPKPLDNEAFHGIAGEIVRAIEPSSEADSAGLLIQLLVGFGNAAGRNAHLKRGDTHFANLFAVLVGRTATARKGTAWAGIRPFLAEADPNWAKKCILPGGLASGEGLVWAVRDPIEKRIESKERKGHFETRVVDSGADDKRLLAFNAEFSSVIRVMQKEGNILSGNLRQAFESGDLNNQSKNSPARATDAHISMIGHITQSESLRLLGRLETENGFANRFLWVCVQRSKILPDPKPIDPKTRNRLVDRLQSALKFAQRPRELRLSLKANEMWDRVYRRMSTDEQPGVLGEITLRGPVLVLRLALIYALLDSNPQIQPGHLKSALAIWRYCQDSARFIFGDSLGYPDAQAILSALTESPKTRTQISSLFQRHRTKQQINAALKHLRDRGLAVKESIRTAGCSQEVWKATDTAKKAKQAKEDDLPPVPQPGVVYRFPRS